MRRFILKLRKRPHLERDLDEELELHREMSGRPFGNSTRIREEARELWTFPFIESLTRDFRHGCRALAKSPSFSLVCLLTLSLGIGINTAVFTLYDSSRTDCCLSRRRRVSFVWSGSREIRYSR